MTRKSRFLTTTGLSIIDQRAAASRSRYGKPMRDAAGHAAAAPAPTPTPTPAAEPTSFDAAFAEAAAEAAGDDGTGGGPAGDAPAAPAAPAAADTAPAGDAPAAPAAGDAAPAGDAPAAPGSEAPTPPAPPADPNASTPPAAPTSAEAVLQGLTDFLKQQTPAAPQAPEAQPQDQPTYTPEEEQVLADYAKNWPDVATGELLRRRAEYGDLLKFVFTQVNQVISPIQEQLRLVGNSMHTQELKAVVPDYSEDLETQVSTWVDTQPSYLQTAYKQVMQNGTSEEVADLIGRYRAAAGQQAPQAPAGQAPTPPAAPAAPAPPAKPKTELSDAAKQAAASLAPVGGDRSQAPAGEDPQDFDTAFQRYASTMDG